MEELLNQDVEKLWELQSVYTQLADRERQLSVKPESFAVIDREWQSANEEMARLEAQIEVLSKERRRVEGELSDQQELLKKYQGQLMQVKNQQQYAAAWKEIDATRKHVKELEDSALKQMGDIDVIQKQLDDRNAAHADLKARYDEAYAAWQSSLGDLRGEANALKKKAEKIEATLAEGLKREFHRVFKQRQGIAVAPVAAESCSACRSRIRPALSQQLKRGDLVHCEGCHRILYLEKGT
ncbi:MAG: Zn-ribbon protein nucleic acid-binding protein [Acidobacteria bacterium]|nr:Zn-ribbon protein nucleic acid-binding protein [Acidobacteriota bacterium]